MIVIVKLFHELFQEWFLKQYYASRRSAIQIVTVTFYEVVLYKGFILIKIEHFNWGQVIYIIVLGMVKIP